MDTPPNPITSPVTDPLPAATSPQAPKNPKLFIFLAIGALAFLLLATIILFSHQKKTSPQNPSLTNTSRVTPTIILYQKAPSPTQIPGMSDVTGKYTAKFFSLSYPNGWQITETKKGATYLEVTIHHPDATENDLNIIVSAVTQITPTQMQVLEKLYESNADNTTEQINTPYFKTILKTVISQANVNTLQGRLPVLQQRTAFFTKRQNMYRAVMTYPGEVENTQYENLFLTLLNSFAVPAQ